jgi:chorismate synthase
LADIQALERVRRVFGNDWMHVLVIRILIMVDEATPEEDGNLLAVTKVNLGNVCRISEPSQAALHDHAMEHLASSGSSLGGVLDVLFHIFVE